MEASARSEFLKIREVYSKAYTDLQIRDTSPGNGKRLVNYEQQSRWEGKAYATLQTNSEGSLADPAGIIGIIDIIGPVAIIMNLVT